MYAVNQEEVPAACNVIETSLLTSPAERAEAMLGSGLEPGA